MTSRTCGYEQRELDALVARQTGSVAEHAFDPRFPSHASATDLSSRQPVLLFAGPLASESGDSAAIATQRRLRAATADLARVLFDRPKPIPVATTWQPSVVLQLLEGAARFGHGSGALVNVYLSRHELVSDQIVPHADWSRGHKIEVPSTDGTWSSLMAAPCRCAIFMGGDPYVAAFASPLSTRLRTSAGSVAPRFAIASTGGAAHKLLSQSRRDYGGDLPHLELENDTSYLLLMKRIVELTAATAD